MDSTRPQPARRSAAFFDLDRTMISGSSVYAFGLAAWRNGMMPTREVLSDAARALTFRFGGASDEKADMVRDRVLRGIQGQTTNTLSQLGDQIIGRLVEQVRNESQGFLALHQEAGRDTYIVTASPIEIVARFADELGMTGAIATVAETVDGVYTGRLAEPFCYGPGKAEAIGKLAQAEGYDLRLCYAYSDSASDLPMLELVGHPVAVNPDRRLEAIARGRGWPIAEFSRTAKMVIRLSTAGAGAVGLAVGTYFLGRHHTKQALQH
jgi:HAD superfamily hydrolase (TIGR01490 family)